MSQADTFTSFRDITMTFLVLLFDRFWCIKKVFHAHFSRFYENLTWKHVSQVYIPKSWGLTIFILWPRDDLDLYHNRNAQEIILTSVRDTIHVDSLALFAAPHWQGDYFEPPLVFLRYLLNQCSHHHQTCSTLSRNNFTYYITFLSPGYYILATNDVRVTSCSTDL